MSSRRRRRTTAERLTKACQRWRDNTSAGAQASPRPLPSSRLSLFPFDDTLARLVLSIVSRSPLLQPRLLPPQPHPFLLFLHPRRRVRSQLLKFRLSAPHHFTLSASLTLSYLPSMLAGVFLEPSSLFPLQASLCSSAVRLVVPRTELTKLISPHPLSHSSTASSSSPSSASSAATACCSYPSGAQ